LTPISVKPSSKSWLGALLPALLLVSVLATAYPAFNPPLFVRTQADGPTPAQGFNVLSATWGTVSSPVEAGPGSVDAPLVVTFQYYYANTATFVEATLSLPSGFTDTNGASNAVAYESTALSSGTVFSLTFYLTVSQDTALGTYSIPVAITWGAIVSSVPTQQSVSLVQNSVITAYLKGKVQLSFQSLQKSLIPGQVNSITMVLTNFGTGEATQISSMISASSSSSQSVTVLSQFQNIAALQAGSNASQKIEVFVPSSAAGLPLVLTLSTNYTDAFGTSRTVSQSLGLYVVPASSVSANTSLSVVTISDSVTSGTISKVSFLIKNIGNSTIYSPDFTLSVASPLVLAGNSTFSSIGTSIAPGESQVFTANMTASPGSTSGMYAATLQVSFRDQYGTSHNQSFSVAFELTGTIDLVVTNAAATFANGNLTVSGTLVNEGTAPAYYAQISGQIFSRAGIPAGSASYLGEIDPNTPLSFSITIPTGFNGTLGSSGNSTRTAFTFTRSGTTITRTGSLSGQSSFNVTLLVTYKDSFGTNLQATLTTRPAVSLGSSGLSGLTRSSKTTSAGLFSTFNIVIIAIVIIVAAVAAVLFRRRRGSKDKAVKQTKVI
jgi:hypothetical protein